MSNISSEKIKTLREKTGAGIMDCKNALVESSGHVELAIDWLRKKGIAKANKKSSRVAAEGLVGLISENKLACLIEVNSETDFVAKNLDFQNFIEQLLKLAIKKKYVLDDFLHSNFIENITIKDALKNLIAKIGENIVIRRLSYLELTSENSKFGFYVHNKVNNNLGKIGCIAMCDLDIDNQISADVLKKMAMHISASKPLALSEEKIDKELLRKEKDIFIEQLSATGKPQDIIDKIVDGKVKKFISEITLLNQNWILEPSKTVQQVISEFKKDNNCNLEMKDYKLFVLGEGIETDTTDFRDEVASQLSNNN